MELVYLWVEEYKNIKKQGFNFSPRFKCEYDEDTKNLEIIDKEETGEAYPKNFFGENINITAIVGENGAGKSSILESIITLISFDKGITKEVSLFLIVYNKKYYKKCINIEIKNDYEILEKTPLLYFNYSLDYMSEKNINFNPFYHRKDYYDIPTVLIPSKKDGNIDIKNIDYIVERNMLEFSFRHEYKFKNIENFFTIKKFRLKNNLIKVMNNRLSDAQYDSESKTSYIKDDIRNNIAAYYKNKEIKENDFILLNNLYLLKKIYENRKKVVNEELKLFLKDDINKITNNDIEKILGIIKEKDFHDIFSDENCLEKVWDAFLFKKKSLNFGLEFSKILNIDNKFAELFECLPGWIDIEFFDENNISLKNLSYGQKFLTRFIYTILYHVMRIRYSYKNGIFIILLDEVELGLHPQWQKQFIKLIYEVLKEVYADLSFNILLSSHSPFLISDLPKQNVIFLEKDKKTGNCVNATNKIEINPFGANIHTLLSHGFFMKDGLMGEFAKDKIQSIIKYHEDIEKKEIIEADKIEYKTKKQKEFWQIQSIIGDDYLKQVIKNHLIEIEKIVLGNDEAKKEEVKRLKAQIELLEK